MRRILVAIDGSEVAQRALLLASEIATAFGAHLTLVHVITPFPVPPNAPAMQYPDIDQGQRSLADLILREAALKLEKPSVPTDRVVLLGKPAEEISQTAKASDVDLVVVGSRGRGAVSRVLLGSVSSRLVHICEKPVLVVH